MGMFDYLRCKYPLPVPGANDLVFQTKDTDSQWLDTYEIAEDGTLYGEEYDIEDRSDKSAPKGSLAGLVGMMTRVNIRKVPCADFTGEIRFYCDYGKKDNFGWGHGWMEFSAYFVQGKLQTLVLIENREPPSDLCERCGGSGWERTDITKPNESCRACHPTPPRRLGELFAPFPKGDPHDT